MEKYMGTIKIVTDSSITIEPELIKALDITVVPLSVMIDSKLYSDNDLKEEGHFLSLMKASKSLPKTSQPPVGLFAETYENLVKKGVTDIVAIHLSPALSGTIEASRQGAEIAEAPVTVLDSGFTDQAMKFQVVEAAKMAKAGASLNEILTAVQAIKSKTELYIGVSTLENLVKGGRIGRVTGVLSSLLNVKVVMALKNDELKTLVKGRGNKTFTKWLDSYLAKNSHRPIAEIAISYAGEASLALTLKERIAAYYNHSISVLETGSIIQTHTGEGAFAVMVRYE
ncbi:TPA: DegV family protein [Streptococcus pyogenes]|nr:DegV family protein [Streptococcus pyogenes]HER4535859.1 DegV family protein [Streptococcus pyogenes NGAS757]HER4587216.1 DegV family protein [Streptococcus pyogenes NGAS615]HER4595708.1 DegV family protein [Streptococcus pyogenes NGAS613]HER4602565.1 DegV family protein [Streptococcus pyogenes NGAS608]HER4605716.1 DegV family protein [Streptococcus pyogenes NGAS609]HER4609135.1 DegV family protein [Streptococcus pyogenes NGAS601]HER4614337.1 DegV family protein [Streptococcus pyogenes NG